MSDYQPKVGDKVMVGEAGPYKVEQVVEHSKRAHLSTVTYWVPFSWLTPAADLEPDKPTAPGALVRDGKGRLWSLSENPGHIFTDRLEALRVAQWGAWCWMAGPAPFASTTVKWHELARPITVVLADPAEVEALREERDQWESDYQEAMRQVDGLRERVAEERSLGAAEKRRADELQQAIEEAVKLVDDPGFWSTYSVTRLKMRDILRGES